MYRILILVAAFTFSTLPFASGQFSGGFVAGLNFATINGPSETNANGEALDNFSFRTSFHLGGRFNYLFNEVLGVRAEILYSQKGGRYNYDGDSYWVFLTEKEDVYVYASGTRSTTLSINNSYFDLPLMVTARFGRLEIAGGGYMAYMVGSRGSGELTFSGVSEGGQTVDPFTIALDFNYFNDAFQREDIGEVEKREIDGETVLIPKSLGAEYQVIVDNEDRLFRRFDYGLKGSLALFLNQGLFLGFRVQYGLSDLTRTERDISRYQLGPNKEPIFLDHKDRNLLLQASIGFNF